MNPQLLGGVYGNAEAVVVEHFVKTHTRLNAANTYRFSGFRILQRKQVEASFRGTALVEGFPGKIDLALQQGFVGR